MEKKVALLGDSIRLYGYGRIVPKLLKGKAAVFQPKENCKFAKNLLRFLFDLKEDLKGCDVIHFNCGLWDVANIVGDGSLFSTDEEYAQNVLRIATALLKITPKVIFATTTPVNPAYPYNKNEDIDRFNALVVPKLQALGVQINDLHALVAEDVAGNICDDKIHLTELGAKRCAAQVARVIEDALAK
ncbi:MAG: SGNH/GDSL hydrolase family protein [Clostridia bacterium]|nr:SGNH/GDSL hydrolase family protein [Clostridia bacterium]